MFRVAGVGGGPFVNAGASRTTMLKACVAFAPMPLLAVMVPPNVPETLGVPLITPAGLIASPGGSAPPVTANVGAGNPLAVEVKLYAVPTVAGEVAGPFVITGAAFTVSVKFCVAAGATPLLAVNWRL